MFKWTSSVLVIFLIYSCGSDQQRHESIPAAGYHGDRLQTHSVQNYPGRFLGNQNYFPFWFVWMDQQNQREEQRIQAELELNRAKAELKRAEAAKELAKIQIALILIQEWQKTLSEIDRSISAHRKQIMTYQTYSSSLTKLDQGKTGGDVVNAFRFFIGKMPKAKALLSSAIGPFSRDDFEAAAYVYQHQDGRVEIIKKEVDSVPETTNTLSGLLNFLSKSKVKVKAGSEAHKALLSARDELKQVAEKLISAESAEVARQMQKKIRVKNSFKDPFATRMDKDES